MSYCTQCSRSSCRGCSVKCIGCALKSPTECAVCEEWPELEGESDLAMIFAYEP